MSGLGAHTHLPQATRRSHRTPGVSATVFKMATSQGYKCKFVDTVPDDLYCKKCALVARKLVIAECCGESYCHSCITEVLDQARPCPACKDDNFTVFQHKKSQKKINSLQVYCSMKERGCVWSGMLEQLDTHLDPDQDECQYVDTFCPLNCQQTIPKNDMDDHLTQHCIKRVYVCQFCSFKATYEDVVDTHLPQCKYVPLDCPNRCGVTFERDFLEDHMKICRLEEVVCEFSGVGCDGCFLREDQENHARENSDKHLTLTASLAIETKDSLIKKLLNQDERHKEEEQKLREKIKEQEQQLTKQQYQLTDQQQQITQQQKLIAGQQLIHENITEKQQQQITYQQQQIHEQQQQITEEQSKVHQTEQDIQRLRQQLQGHEKKFAEVLKFIESLEQTLYVTGIKHSFVMTDFTKEKLKDKPGDWKSPAMYTHTRGYKFCVGVDANGSDGGRGNSINAEMWVMPGEYDNWLKWPAQVDITIELVNRCGGQNVKSRSSCKWDKPSQSEYICKFCHYSNLKDFYRPHKFMNHSDIDSFLAEDSLHFKISHIIVISS